jgi:uncharacterized membrane protein
MLYKLTLRIASILCLAHAAIHQLGTSQAPTNPEEVALIAAMSNFQMDVMGSLRSYTDFFAGMGVFETVMFVGLTVLLWQLSNIRSDAKQAICPLLATVAITFLAFTAISIKYFFVLPVVMEALIAVLVGVAYFDSGRHAA